MDPIVVRLLLTALVLIVVAVTNYSAISMPASVPDKIRNYGLAFGILGLFFTILTIMWPFVVLFHYFSDGADGFARAFLSLVSLAGICTAGSAATMITAWRKERSEA